jgi:hypothetical protein
MSSAALRSVLKNKATTLTVQEVKVPAAIADPATLFAANSAPKFDQANVWTIDVFPSQQTILMYIMILASSVSAAADHKDHAKSSVFTFTMYYMCIYHALFLINDLYVRPSPSAHAQIWQESSWRSEFVEFLLTLPVPDHMKFIFERLAATNTDRTKNVFFVPSAAGFRHDIFFGRFFPLAMFTHMHDVAATYPGTTKREEIYSALLSHVLYTITPSTGTPFPVFFADLLGIHTSATTSRNPVTTANIPKSRLNQIFDKVFNPVLFRDFHRRSSLAAIELSSPKYTTSHRHVNAYDCLFSATAPNLRELKVVLQAVAPLIASTTKCTSNIGTLISAAANSHIFQHGYSDFALPTWMSHDFSSSSAHTFPNIDKTAKIELDALAAATGFLQIPARRPTATTDLNWVTVSNPGTSTTTTPHWPWTLVLADPPTDPYPDTDIDFVQFDEQYTPNPKVLVMDTTGTETVSAHLATLLHMIIESYELDGTTVSHPRADKPLGLTNSMFADSAIPYDHVVRGTSFYKRTGTMILPLKRARPTATRNLEASSLLHDRTLLMLPSLSPSVIDSATSVANVYSALPGHTHVGNVDWIRYVQSFLGFKTKHKSSDSPTAPATELGRLYLFSPYSYTSYEDEDQDAPTPALNESAHYFITNLRSFFGTDYNFVEVKHPFEAMPVL